MCTLQLQNLSVTFSKLIFLRNIFLLNTVYSRSCTANKHAALKRPKLLLLPQFNHLVIRIDHKPYMVLIVIDPDFVPFSAVQLSTRLDVHLSRRSSTKRKIKRKLIVTGQRNHKRRVIRSDGWLKQQNRLFTGCAK